LERQAVADSVRRCHSCGLLVAMGFFESICVRCAPMAHTGSTNREHTRKGRNLTWLVDARAALGVGPQESATMFSIQRCELTQGALLSKYQHGGAYADCYVTEAARRVSHAEYVEAFYTTILFKVERLLLSWLVSKPSTDVQASQLAAGTLSSFAAWSVEARSANQLLMSDFQGRTRSWLMVSSAENSDFEETRLYFGSAVVPAVSARSVAALHACFPKSAWARVLALLDTYGVASHEREVARVQLAILKLSEGSEEKLREYIAVAKRDYRDALYWAEYPDESKVDTPEKKRKLRELFEKLGVEPPPGLLE
jgi:hypothetical protein